MSQHIQFIGFTPDQVRQLFEQIIIDCLHKPTLYQNSQPEKPLNISEACRILGVSAPTLRKFVKEGKIRRHDLGHRKKVFYLSELQEDIKNLKLS